MANKINYNNSDNWVHEKCHIDFLTDSVLHESITIFLGSGISSHFGLPLWNTLMQNLAAKSRVDCSDFDSNLKLAKHIRETKLNGDLKTFNTYLHESLYDDCDTSFGKLRTHHTLAAVFSLLMISKGRNPSSVVTLNYDDILETYLNYHGVKTASSYGSNIINKNVDIMVYHPHGFLPAKVNKQQLNQRVVITSSDYAKKVGDVGDPWHVLVLDKLLTTRPIFIGLGTDDLNLENLLARRQQINGTSRLPFYGIAFNKKANKDTRKDWEEYDVYCKSVDDYDESIANFLFKVCQSIAEQT